MEHLDKSHLDKRPFGQPHLGRCPFGQIPFGQVPLDKTNFLLVCGGWYHVEQRAFGNDTRILELCVHKQCSACQTGHAINNGCRSLTVLRRAKS